MLTEEQIDEVSGGWIPIAVAIIGVAGVAIGAWLNSDDGTVTTYEKCDYQTSTGDQYKCEPATSTTATKVTVKKIRN